MSIRDVERYLTPKEGREEIQKYGLTLYRVRGNVVDEHESAVLLRATRWRYVLCRRDDGAPEGVDELELTDERKHSREHRKKGLMRLKCCARHIMLDIVPMRIRVDSGNLKVCTACLVEDSKGDRHYVGFRHTEVERQQSVRHLMAAAETMQSSLRASIKQ